MAEDSVRTWKREPGSVMLGIDRDQELVIVPEGLTRSTSGVDEVTRSIYGALHAEMDSCSGQIHVSVATNINHTDSSSFQFDHYVCTGGDPAGTEKPPKIILFESKEFPSHFITWTLPTDCRHDMPDNAADSTCANSVVKCEYLPKTRDDLPDIQITTTGAILRPRDSEVKRFVWVVPVDDQNTEQFALRAFDQHYYLVFKQPAGKAMMVPAGQINPELKIFRLHSLQ